jgi:hypothetical protein
LAVRSPIRSEKRHFSKEAFCRGMASEHDSVDRFISTAFPPENRPNHSAHSFGWIRSRYERCVTVVSE